MPSAIQNIGSQLVRLGSRLIGRRLMSVGRNVFNISAPEVYSNITTETAIEKGFNDNVVVYSVVMKDADKFGSIPRYIYSTSSAEEKATLPGIAKEVKALKMQQQYTANRALTQLINRPNPYQSQDAFYTQLRAYYKTTGEAFIWCNRGDLEGYRNADGTLQDEVIDKLPVIEMYVVPSDHMALIPDPENAWGCLGWIFTAATEVVMRAGDVIHWKNPGLSFDIATREHQRGFTPLRPGSKTIEESNSVSKASMRAAQNDGAKAVIYDKSLHKMSPSQSAEVKKVIDAKINNNDVTSSVASIQGDWGLLDLSQTAKDQMHIEKKEMLWKEICFLLKVPYEFFDSKTTYANKEQAQIGWVTNDIIPACKQLDGEMNRVLPKAFGLDRKVFIGTDYSDLPEIQKAMAATAKALKEAGWFTPNEIREVMGYDALPETEFDEVWPASGEAPFSQSKIDAEALNYETMRLDGYAVDRTNGNGQVSQNGKRTPVPGNA
jgi:phage portal protein BeeE